MLLCRVARGRPAHVQIVPLLNATECCSPAARHEVDEPGQGARGTATGGRSGCDRRAAPAVAPHAHTRPSRSARVWYFPAANDVRFRSVRAPSTRARSRHPCRRRAGRAVVSPGQTSPALSATAWWRRRRPKLALGREDTTSGVLLDTVPPCRAGHCRLAPGPDFSIRLQQKTVTFTGRKETRGAAGRIGAVVTMKWSSSPTVSVTVRDVSYCAGAVVRTRIEPVADRAGLEV